MADGFVNGQISIPSITAIPFGGIEAIRLRNIIKREKLIKKRVLEKYNEHIDKVDRRMNNMITYYDSSGKGYRYEFNEFDRYT